MKTFDYIITGGGSAGCVIAARLTEDPAKRVLLLEAGGTDGGRMFSIPAGFAKMLACAETDGILGVHIIGPNASELIWEGVVAMEFGAASEDLARICHAHPTLSEAMIEATLDAFDGAIHI